MVRTSAPAALAAVLLSIATAAPAQTVEAVDSKGRGGVVALADRVTILENQVVQLQSALAGAQTAIAGLTGELAAAQGRIGALEADLATATGRISSAESRVTALEGALAALQADPVFAFSGFLSDLAGCVSVDVVLRDIDGDSMDETLPRVLVAGCNLQIVNGVGTTHSANGLGNLLVGYDEARPDTTAAFLETCADGRYDNEADCLAAGKIWGQNHKSGSHNLVVGTHNNYSSFGGAVFGVINTVNNQYATVTAGSDNIASGFFSTVGGGLFNTASGDWSAIQGGLHNRTTAYTAAILGGQANTAGGSFSVVGGGEQNQASGDGSSVSGGLGRAATARSNWAAGSLFEPN